MNFSYSKPAYSLIIYISNDFIKIDFSFRFMRKIIYCLIASLGIIGFSCTPEISYELSENLSGLRVLIVSEGQFGYGTSSLTTLSHDGSVVQDVFRSINNRPMGDGAQSATLIGDILYVPMNKCKRIGVMESPTIQC